MTVLLASLLSTSACDCRSYFDTPLEALTERPGLCSFSLREGVPPPPPESVEILQREEIAGGIVLIYRLPLDGTTGDHVLARTFVTHESGLLGSGWQAQSSCQVVFVDSDTFVAGWCPGGNVTALTTAYGITYGDETVRVEWSDGRIDTLAVQDGSFVQSRPVTLQVRRIELLDASGAVLQSKGFDYD